MTVLLRLAVFDVDGTLIDSQHNIIAAMTAAWRLHGLGDPRPEAVRRIIGLSLVEACARLLPQGDEALHHSLAHAYKDAFMEMRNRPDHTEPLFPGTREALDRLEDEGWLLGLATGKSRHGVEAMLERHGFQNRFITRQTADDHPGKPHPAMVLAALAETGVEPRAAAMIGDTAYDMRMAVAAGVHGVGVTWGYHAPDELREAGAERLVDDYSELGDLLNQLCGSARGNAACV